MGSFGERLQREREMRGITLEEIAEATKIGTRSLRALEEQDFQKLPGGIFNKGFVRAYSRYLGIDEEQAVADYVNAVNESVAERAAAEASAEPAKTTVIADEQPQPLPKIAWKPILLLLVAVAVVFGAWRYYAKHGMPKLGGTKAAPKSEVLQPPPPPTPSVPANLVAQSTAGGAQGAKPATQRRSGLAAPAAAASGTEISGNNASAGRTSIGTTPASLSEENPFSVKVHATAESWVSITADGRPVIEGVLAADTEKSVHAQRSVVVKTGNAGGVELFHNGKPVPALGELNQVKTVTLGPDGVKN